MKLWELPYLLYEDLNDIVEFTSTLITSVCAENIRYKSVTIRTKGKPGCEMLFVAKT